MEKFGSSQKQTEMKMQKRKTGDLASAKPGRGVVTTHKCHTRALDSAVEEHQLGEALRLHEFCWLKSMAAETMQKPLCNGSSATQQPVTRKWRRNVERESGKREEMSWVE